MNEFPEPYTYGVGQNARTYHPQPWHPTVLRIRQQVEELTGEVYEACFLNQYRDGRDNLGWHADNSPGMDNNRHIVVVSLGARREIFFRDPNDKEAGNEILWLEHGSVLLMAPGMQQTHQHKVPRASYGGCGTRISLTFRGFVRNV